MCKFKIFLCKFCANNFDVWVFMRMFVCRNNFDMDYRISFVLDTRRPNKEGLFPLKLRVYDSIRQKAKLYTVTKYYSVEDFEKITERKPSKKYLEDSIFLKSIEAKAEKIAKDLSPFNFFDFEAQFYGNLRDKSNIIDYYVEAIEFFKKEGQIKTAESYQSSLKSIKKFLNESNPERVSKLHIIDITIAWLNKYEKYMLGKSTSYTTIGIYLRPLRALYNKAISDNPSYQNHYPFGKNRYEIPSTVSVKKALDKDTLEKLYQAESQNEHQEKAKDFWFFSYVSNGMNINDIAQLKFKDISLEENKMTFYRGKTQRTSKRSLKKISVLLTEYSKGIIEKYKNEETDKEQFVFPIISHEDSLEEQKRKIANFIRYINQHIKRLAFNNNLSRDISTYWARHSFSTMALNSGANIELISESLGHSDIRTTKAYLNGFDDSNKEVIINKITDFL